MQFMILRRADAGTEAETGAPPPPGLLDDMLRFNAKLAAEGRLGLALGLRPSRRAVRLRLGPDGASITDGPFAETKELVAGFTIIEAASKEDAVAIVRGWPPSDAGACGGITLEVRETGCPGGCAQVPPAAEGEGERYVILLRSTDATERDAIPPRAALDALNAFNAAEAASGRLLAGDGLKSSARGARVSFKGGQASVIDGPFAEAKELIAGFWMIRAGTMDEAIAWARTLPYPTGPRVEVEIREVMTAADLGLPSPARLTPAHLTPEQARADHGLRTEALDAALRASLAGHPASPPAA